MGRGKLCVKGGERNSSRSQLKVLTIFVHCLHKLAFYIIQHLDVYHILRKVVYNNGE